MEKPNPFKEIESDAICPPHIKLELVSEIDVIRNTITIIDLYIGDLFGMATVLLSPSSVTFNDENPTHETTS